MSDQKRKLRKLPKDLPVRVVCATQGQPVDQDMLREAIRLIRAAEEQRNETGNHLR